VPLSGKLPVVTPTTSQLYQSTCLNASYLATSNHFNLGDLIMSHKCHGQLTTITTGSLPVSTTSSNLSHVVSNSQYWEPSHSCPNYQLVYTLLHTDTK